MSNPYRAMCAELHTAIQLYTGQNPAAANVPPAELVCRLMDAMAASAALLAQPEPEGLTDEALDEMERRYWKLGSSIEIEPEGISEVWDRKETFDHRAFARAAIAADRARRPTPQPEPEGLTDDKLMDIARATDLVYYMGKGRGFASPYMEGTDITKEVLAYARAVLAKWSHPTPQPVAVSERLPGAKDCAPWPGDPDATPWCWAGKDIDGGWEWAQISMLGLGTDTLGRIIAGGGWTHWLPANALPIPQGNDN